MSGIGGHPRQIVGRAVTVAMVIAAVVVLAGCGGDNASGNAKAGPAKTTPATPTSQTPTIAASPTPVGLSLLEICPQVEAALPRDLMVPDQPQLAQIKSTMEPIFQSADLEAQNALQLFIDGIDAASAAYQDTTDPVPAITASQEFDDGLSAFANRCKAAGSTALQ